MEKTDHYNGKIFLNPVPTEVMQDGAFWRVLKNYFKKDPTREPQKSLGPFWIREGAFSQPPSQEIKITWLGHSTLIIELDGKRFLTDPVWYERVSPFTGVGPKRFFANPLKLERLPPIDYILLSHDHYDHLDKHTIILLAQRGIPVITLLGVGNRLLKWGINKNQITELDWGVTMLLELDFKITAAPARHFSGRWIGDRFTTLWGAFAIQGPAHKVFFGADSGYFDGFKTIGDALGPFDVALLEIGAYNPDWAHIHMGPENAVQAAIDLKADVLLPVHWGTFNLAFHPWKEPVERLIAEAGKRNYKLVLPTPGETVTITGEAYNSNWWGQFT